MSGPRWSDDHWAAVVVAITILGVFALGLGVGYLEFAVLEIHT